MHKSLRNHFFLPKDAIRPGLSNGLWAADIFSALRYVMIVPCALIWAVAVAAIPSKGHAQTTNTIVVACDTTGVTDCSSLLNAAENQLNTGSNGGGGHVILPAGTINLSNGATIQSGIWTSGQGWEEFSGTFGSGARGTNGTYIYTSNISTSPITCGTIGGAGSSGGSGCSHARLSDVAFTESQPADSPGWTPTGHAPSIMFYGYSFYPEDILFWGVYEGIQAGTASATTGFAGRVSGHHIYGACYNWCIDEESVADVNAYDDVFIEAAFLQGLPNQISYISKNGVGIRFSRSDNPYLSNIFILEYGQGIVFASNANFDGLGTSNLEAVNIDCDGCGIGMVVSERTVARFSNFQNQTNWNGSSCSTSTSPLSQNIVITSGASNVQFDMVNTNLNNACAFAITDSSGSADLNFVNLRLGTFDYSNGGYTGISTVSGDTVCIAGRFQGLSANGTAKTSGVTPTKSYCSY